MEHNARQQLRAYIHLRKPRAKGIREPGATPQLHLMFHNYGRTPAYKLNLEGVNYAWGPTFEEAKERGEPKSRFLGPLGPGASVKYFSDPLPQVRVEQAAGLANKTLSFFVFGTLRYMDAFKRDRYLKFRLMIGGETGTTNGEILNICQENNETDDP